MNDPDDGPLFWIAIGKAQCHYKEVTEDVALKAKEGLEYLMNPEISLNKRDAESLCKKLFSDEYRQPPKARRKIPPKKYCTWAVGDVYAMPMRGPEAKEAYLDDTFLLIRVFAYEKIGNTEYPSVLQMIWLDEKLPTSDADINKSGYLVINEYGGWRKKKPVFDVYLKFDSKKEFEQFNANLIYVGNFPDALLPEVDVSELYAFFECPDEILHGACYAFHNHGIEYLNV